MKYLSEKAKDYICLYYYNHKKKMKHCLNVGELCKVFNSQDIIVAAGYLHDIVEDYFLSFSYIEKCFGKPVSNLVNELTNDSIIENCKDKKKRSVLIAEKVMKMSSQACLIKLIDRFEKALGNKKIDCTKEILNRAGSTISTYSYTHKFLVQKLEDLCQ